MISTRKKRLAAFVLTTCAAIFFGMHIRSRMIATSILKGTTAGDVRTDNGLQMASVWCPPGDFTMGSPPHETNRTSTENQAKITLSDGFWIGQTEVTQDEWRSVMATEPWSRQEYVKDDGSCPATHVSWEDATSFCREMTRRERSAGRLSVYWEYRLPTEAEWEYACRAGSLGSYSFGTDVRELNNYAWWGSVIEGSSTRDEWYAHRTARKRANPWRLYDVHGNVSEWCSDWYSKELREGKDPIGPSEGLHKVHRGGSWRGPHWACRSAARGGDLPAYRSNTIGFRVVLAPVR